MATTQLPHDFKEFLKLLNTHEVRYLLVGGHAVSYYGYPRPTGDIDLWVPIDAENAERLVAAMKSFGFDAASLSVGLFLQPDQVVRMGRPPMRIDVLTSIAGVDFESCYSRRVFDKIDGVDVDVISLDDLKTNKRTAGRHRDLNDLENLP